MHALHSSLHLRQLLEGPLKKPSMHLQPSSEGIIMLYLQVRHFLSVRHLSQSWCLLHVKGDVVERQRLFLQVEQEVELEHWLQGEVQDGQVEVEGFR